MSVVRMLGMSLTLGLFALGALSTPAAAQELAGASLGLGWGAPFAGILATIALGQAAAPDWWERHYGKLALAWIAATVIPLTLVAGPAVAWHELAHLLIIDYLPFLVVLATLYVVAGGIAIRTRMSGHPLENSIVLAAGTMAAAILGTPGATLLCLPVLLTANGWRRHQAHTMVFLIFLVSNIGGGLTPLGPPLLIGYLNGVDFLWTVEHMLAPTALAAILLLGAYYLLDQLVFFPREDTAARAAHREEHDSLQVSGATNIALLLVVVAVIIGCGNWKSAITVPLGLVEMPLPDVARIVALSLVGWVSLRRTAPEVRLANQFGWGPMREVAIVFAGIFITMLPPLAILKAGSEGALGGLIALVTAADGTPLNWGYFIVTGSLSAILDNTPTFLVFFNAAGGDAQALMGPHAQTLAAISAGAAFWGGATYIGNAPNFMVRGVALRRGVAMPNFFSFMVWSVAVLLPVFGVLAAVFFAATPWMAAGAPLMGVAFAIHWARLRRRTPVAFGDDPPLDRKAQPCESAR